MDLFKNITVTPGGKLHLKDPNVVQAFKEWEIQRRQLQEVAQELTIKDSTLVQEMATLKAQHELVECEKMRTKAVIDRLRAELWLSISKTEPAFDMQHDWTIVREESTDTEVTIMREIDQNQMMREMLVGALQRESKERTVGFGR